MDNDLKELKTSFDEIKGLFDTEFKEAVAKGETERKEFGDQLGLTKETLAKMEDRFVKHDEAWEKFQEEKKAQEATEAAEGAAEGKTAPTEEANEPKAEETQAKENA